MRKKKKSIEINEEFQRALEVMENTRRHVFVTGRAGTGKSTLLEHFRENTKKKVAVLAPHGRCGPQCAGADDPQFLRLQAKRHP